MLPLQDPAAAARELRRGVDELGFLLSFESAIDRFETKASTA